MAANPEGLQRTYLGFVSSGLTSHAASIVGLAVLLFSSISVFGGKDFLPKMQFPLPLVFSLLSIDYIVVFVAFWILCTGIFYSFMRLMYYGALAYEIITLKDCTPDSLGSLHRHVCLKIKGMTNWFSVGVSLRSRGFMFSWFVGFLISSCLFFVLFVR